MIGKMEVREDDDTFKNEIDFLFEELEERAPQHFALRQYKKFKLSAGGVL
jgi:type IV secretion system protein VirD4